MSKTTCFASIVLSSVFLLCCPGVARSLDLQDILEAINQGMQESNEQQAIEQCSQPSHQSDVWCNLFWQMRGGRPTRSSSPNSASDTSIATLIQLYQSASQQRQAAEARFRACTSTSSSPLSCSSTVAESHASSENTYRDMVGQALIDATERTYNNPSLCPQTISSYRQAVNVGLPFAANMSNIVTFCRSHGMTF